MSDSTESRAARPSLRVAALAGLAALPLALALAGCSIPKLGTELGPTSSNPAAPAASSVFEDDEGTVSPEIRDAVASSSHDAVASSSAVDRASSSASDAEVTSEEPEVPGKVYSHAVVGGVNIVTPAYEYFVADGDLPEGWTFTYDDGTYALPGYGDLRYGHVLEVFDAQGAELFAVEAVTSIWSGVSSAGWVSQDLGALPGEPGWNLVVMAPYDEAEGATDADRDRLASYADGVTVTSGDGETETAASSLADQASSSSDRASSADRGSSSADRASSSADRSSTTDRAAASAAKEGAKSSSSTRDAASSSADAATSVVPGAKDAVPSPYDSTSKQAYASPAAGGSTDVSTPYYDVNVPSDAFDGAWTFAYDDSVSVSGERMVGHSLSIYPMGSDASDPQAVEVALTKGDLGDFAQGRVAVTVGSYADGWDVTLLVREQPYGPGSASGFEKRSQADAAVEQLADDWSSRVGVVTATTKR